MKCSDAQKLISKRADGVPGGDALSTHVADCPACRQFAAFCDALPASLHRLTVDAASDRDFVAGVMDRVRSERRPLIVPWRWADVIRPLPIGVAAAAFALGVFVTAAAESVANGTESTVQSADASIYDAGFGIETVDDAVLDLVDDGEE